MRVVAIVQARLGSQRLPSKVLMPIAGEPMIAHVLRRAKQIPSVDLVVLATDYDGGPLAEIAVKMGVDVTIGPYEPLARYVEAVNARDIQDDDYVVRITGDCPGLDPVVSNAVVRLALDNNLPYASNVVGWPDGLDTEVFEVGVLRESHEWAKDGDREHVTPWMRAKMWAMRADGVVGPYPPTAPPGDRRSWGFLGPLAAISELPGGPGRGWKWSVDTEEDMEYVRELYRGLGREWGYRDALALAPGAVCPLCADGVPYPQRSLTSIGGVPTYTVQDIHEVPVSGGVAYEPCEAWQLVIRGHGQSPAQGRSLARPGSTP